MRTFMTAKRLWPWRLAAGLCFAVALAGAWRWHVATSHPVPPVPAPVAFGDVAAQVTTPAGQVQSRCLMLAKTPAQLERGLMEVRDPGLGHHDGMIFAFGADTQTPFWMRDTPMPLTIAYLDVGGRLVSTADMAPCGKGIHCPAYPATRPYRYALEVPQGRLAAVLVDPGSTLTVGSSGCAHH